MRVEASAISKYRKRIHDLLKEVEHLATRCLYTDSIIHGVPNEVYRKCGNKNCKCNKGGDDRHGPYRVIQVPTLEGKKQIALRKDQSDIWDKVTHYQYQINSLAELRKKFTELATIISEVIDLRTEEFTNNDRGEK